MRTLRLALAGSATLLVAAVAAAPAYAAVPDAGHFSGHDGVGLTVGRTAHGSPTVESAHFHQHTNFATTVVHHDGTFRTCARHGHTHTVFREYCLVGTFHHAGHASGTVEVFRGAMGHVAAQPYEQHHFSVARTS